MKTRQKSKIEDRTSDTRYPRGVWRLDLELPKHDILKDLEALAFVPIPSKKPSTAKDRSVESHALSRSVEIASISGKNVPETAHVSTREQNGKLSGEKRQLRERPAVLAKKRPAPEAEDKAAKGLYRLCKEMWADDRKVEKPTKSKLVKDKNGSKSKAISAEDVSRENGRSFEMETPEVRPQNDLYQSVEVPIENGMVAMKEQQQNYIKSQMRGMPGSFGYSNFYDASSIQEFYRLAPAPFMDSFPMAQSYAQPPPVSVTKNGSEALTQMYKEFHEKYLRAPHKRAHLHAIIAYYIYGCQSQLHVTSARGQPIIPIERRIPANYTRADVDMFMNGRLLNIPTHQ